MKPKRKNKETLDMQFEDDMTSKDNLKIALPEIGETRLWKGHEFVVAAIEPYVRKSDGGNTNLIVWELRIHGMTILRGKTSQYQPRALSTMDFQLVPPETACRESAVVLKMPPRLVVDNTHATGLATA
jgi:hypothetical protein